MLGLASVGRQVLRDEEQSAPASRYSSAFAVGPDDQERACEARRRHAADATMAVRLHEWENPFGVVNMNGIRITDFREKPVYRSHINAGVYVFSSLWRLRRHRRPLWRHRWRTGVCNAANAVVQ